jgi:hypothetical protein
MKKEMARLKDSAPDLPHRERYVSNWTVLVFLFRHIRRFALWTMNCQGPVTYINMPFSLLL